MSTRIEGGVDNAGKKKITVRAAKKTRIAGLLCGRCGKARNRSARPAQDRSVPVRAMFSAGPCQTLLQNGTAAPSAKFFHHLLHILGPFTVTDQQRIGRRYNDQVMNTDRGYHPVIDADQTAAGV